MFADQTFMTGQRLDILAMAMAWLMLLSSGCGEGHPPTYQAGGTAKLADGTPLAGGRVEFQSTNSPAEPSAWAMIQPDGSFQLGTFNEGDGALEGEHRVLIIPPPPPRDRGWERGLFDQTHSANVPRIDIRYRRFETSVLRFTVSRDPSKNQFRIVLEPPQ